MSQPSVQLPRAPIDAPPRAQEELEGSLQPFAVETESSIGYLTPGEGMTEALWIAVIAASGALLAAVCGPIATRTFSKKEADPRLRLALRAAEVAAALLVEKNNSLLEYDRSEAVRVLRAELFKCNRRVDELLGKLTKN